MAPPEPLATLDTIVQSLTARLPSRMLMQAPPSDVELPMKVLPLTVSVPLKLMAPPELFRNSQPVSVALPPPPTALPLLVVVKVLSLTVRVPPPDRALPLLAENTELLTVSVPSG